MHYKMYEEMMEQPRSLKDTMKAEKSHMKEMSEKFDEFDKIYLVGCGSSLSTCFSSKDAMNMVSNRNLEVFTGYEFFYHKNLQEKKCRGNFNIPIWRNSRYTGRPSKSKEGRDVHCVHYQ